jgi:hypothetical protein
MDTVCDKEMAKSLMSLGGVGCIHRFMSIEEQCKQIEEVSEHKKECVEEWGIMFDDWHTEIADIPVMAAIGVMSEDVERAKELVKSGANVILIDVAHGHHLNVKNMVEKLKSALTHLPKVAPEKGVYQGDMMFTDDDKKSSKDGVSFRPNPSDITYTATGSNGSRAKKARIGVVTHLSYTGKNSASLNASHEVDHENFKPHSDVFSVDPRMDTSKVHFGPKDRADFNKHMAAAQAVHDTHGDDMYAGTKMHHGAGGHLESYINHTVRSDEQSNHNNFKTWLETKKNKEIDKLKVEKNKKAKQDELSGELDKIERNKKHYNNLFKLHNHLQKAKNVLINVMNQHQEFQHEHGGEAANPEGYVFHHGKESDKFVNRAEFSRRNFAGIRNI